MNGKTTKYRKYEGSGSGRINIPIALAESLNWKNGDEIDILSHTYKGIGGLFLYKKDVLKGIEEGGNDYVVKPFGIHELLARIRAVLRRKNAKPINRDDSPINFGDIDIDPAALIGKKGNKEFQITLREIDLLRIFIKNQGKVLDRNTLLDKIWGVKYEGTTRTLDQHIVKLRQKIEDDPANPKYIITVHTVGYKFANSEPNQ